MTLRTCYRCPNQIPETSRADAMYCSGNCQRSAWNASKRIIGRLQVEFADWTYDDAVKQGIVNWDVALRFHSLRPVLEVEFPGSSDRDQAFIDGIHWDDDGSPISQRVLKGDADINYAAHTDDWSDMTAEAERMMSEARGYIVRGLQGHSQDDPLVDNDPPQP